ARLDAIGVFGYSDEDGTEAASYDGKLDDDVIAERVEELARIVDEVTVQRAEERIGETVVVLVESTSDGVIEGRAAHQGPEVDGTTIVAGGTAKVGDLVTGAVIANEGVDLVIEPTRSADD
ncbi:MAG TPA: hypothetical protein PKK40_10455, partial [Marmoricola sp.]|nr:hypothetical protein [Marmoricola sp.]